MESHYLIEERLVVCTAGRDQQSHLLRPLVVLETHTGSQEFKQLAGTSYLIGDMQGKRSAARGWPGPADDTHWGSVARAAGRDQHKYN